MALAVFLPSDAAVHLKRCVRCEELLTASCWRELTSLISDTRVTAAVVDPDADGKMNVATVMRLMARRPVVPVIAYVPPTPWHLKAIFKLSKYGLKDVFIHPMPSDDHRFLTVVSRTAANRLAFDFLGRMETRIASLPPTMIRAIEDLYERPLRYESGADLAAEAGVSVKGLRRRLETARLGSPAKLVTAAKLLRGYTTLRASPSTVTQIGRAIGFDSCKRFTNRTSRVFGCSPEKLRLEPNSEEIVLQLIEWLYRPSRQGRRRQSLIGNSSGK
jgi:AraC-like DNA-binding protein